MLLENQTTEVLNVTNHGNSSITKETGSAVITPKEITFTDDSLVSVVTYAVLFTVAAAGNLTLFIKLLRSRGNARVVSYYVIHLCVADMIVTFIMMPMEVGWHLTVSWLAGDAVCRLLMFCRAFGFYLSSFVLIAISVDRYVAVACPLSRADARWRARLLLSWAWILSAVASTSQVN